MEKCCKDCKYYSYGSVVGSVQCCKNKKLLEFISVDFFYSKPDFSCKFFKRYIKSCPFCGADGVVVKENNNTYVTCRICGAETSKCTQERTAVNIWNKRVKKED